METTRQKKISRLLQKELAEIFRRRSNELTPGRMITVTIVRVSADLSIARVYLSIFPSEESDKAISVIRDASRQIRYELGQSVHSQIRKIPELSFFSDDSHDYIDNIERLLEE